MKPYTVKDLREALAHEKPDTPVVFKVDGEVRDMDETMDDEPTIYFIEGEGLVIEI